MKRTEVTYLLTSQNDKIDSTVHSITGTLRNLVVVNVSFKISEKAIDEEWRRCRVVRLEVRFRSFHHSIYVLQWSHRSIVHNVLGYLITSSINSGRDVVGCLNNAKCCISDCLSATQIVCDSVAMKSPETTYRAQIV